MDDGRGWLRAGAACAWFTAVGFGGPCVWSIWKLRETGVVPTLLGYPTYGGGPFEDLGFATSLPMLGGFLLVCVMEAYVGWRLWGGHSDGAALALVALVPGALFWWGFALPVAPVVAVVRTLCVAVGWQAHTGTRRGSHGGAHHGRPQLRS
jgi:hypothetical protein